MSTGYWDQVQAADFEVPADRPLDDLTAELTTMLGSTRPEVRDGTAYPALATWIDRGVYDDLLTGLGDGMVAGLGVGLGEAGTDSVFRRSFSALIVAECLERDNAQHLVPASKVLDWGDRLAVWFLSEKDTRGFVAGKGWAHAIAHGADAIGALAGSPHMSAAEHEALLDVLAERLVQQPADEPLASGEPDRMAHAAMRVLRRGTLGIDLLEPWVHRLGGARQPVRRSRRPRPVRRHGGAAGVPARALRPALAGARAAAGPLRPAAGRHRGAPDVQRSLPRGAYQRVAGR